MKLGPLLDQFNDYSRVAYTAGLKLTVDDIALFLREFLTKRTFKLLGALFYGASSKIDGEPRFIFDENMTTEEHFQEIMPILVEAYTKAYGAPSGSSFTQDWPAAPFVADSEQSRARAAKIKERIAAYNQLTMPFRLRKTMHHRIHTIGYSYTAGRVISRQSRDDNPVILSDYDQVNDMLEDPNTYMDSLYGGKSENLRDLWFEYTTETGDNPKFGVFDLDNPAQLPDAEHKRVVREVSKQLRDSGRAHIIMFTGKNYQVWFAPREDERFDHITNVATIAEGMAFKAGCIVGRSKAYRDRAVVEQKIWLDTSVFKRKQKIGFFFGLHYKPGKDLNASTGLARVPVRREELSKFEPLVDAHPETVMQNFDALKARVDAFCQAVELGDGFPFSDSGYPCYRTPRDKPDKKNKLAVQLNDWKYKPRFVELSKDVVGEEALMNDEVVLTPKLDGWVGLMSYNRMGGFKVNGKSLDTTQKREGISNKVEAERQTAILCTKGGMFAWDNYLTHEFERACRSLGIAQATVVGELITYDSEGKVAGVGSVGSILSRQEGDIPAHDNRDFRKLKFVITDVLEFDDLSTDDLPIQQRLDLMNGVDLDRVKVTNYLVIDDDHQEMFDAFWSREVERKGNEGVILYGGGRRYKVKNYYTLDAAIIGIDTTSKVWQDKKRTLPTVIIAVSKTTAKGPVYIAFQRVGSFMLNKQEREDLFQRVMGEETEEWNFANHIRALDDLQEGLIFVEPTTVVEVRYTGLGPETKPAYGLRKKQQRGGGRSFTLRPESAYGSRRLLGTPTLTRVRYDKSVDNPTDISERQADGAGGLMIGKRKKVIVDEGIENPQMPSVMRVRTNPLYGYSAGPRYVAGGGPDSGYGKYGPGHPAASDARLSMEKEFTGQSWQGKSDWKPHYRPSVWREARQTPDGGANYYPDLTGFPASMSDAIFDERGPIISSKGESPMSKYDKFRSLLTEEYHENPEQQALDAEYAMALAVDGGESDDRRDFVRQSMGGAVDLTRGAMLTKHPRPLPEVLLNPASSNQNWNSRLEDYRAMRSQWEKKPQPKPDWDSVASGTFSSWELPLLEKGRLYLEAEEAYKYTEAEEAIIGSRLPTPAGGEAHLFSSIVIDEVEEEDDDEPGQDSA